MNASAILFFSDAHSNSAAISAVIKLTEACRPLSKLVLLRDAIWYR